MPCEYTAENHDWDLTLRASWNLVMAGQIAKGKPDLPFSFLTGGMILAFCAIESFINSMAFSMSADGRYPNFDYARYVKQQTFWKRFRMLASNLGIKVDLAVEPFCTMERMRLWRNSLVHSSPYRIETTFLPEPADSVKLHRCFRSKEFGRAVTIANARLFFECVWQVIDLLKKESGLDPRPMCTYRVL